jgi:hypothetical protein
MANKWLVHVKKTMKAMKKRGTYKKGMGLGAVIKEAKKSWRKGGADEPKEEPVMSEPAAEMPAPVAGRRRKGSKTRRHRK